MGSVLLSAVSPLPRPRWIFLVHEASQTAKARVPPLPLTQTDCLGTGIITFFSGKQAHGGSHLPKTTQLRSLEATRQFHYYYYFFLKLPYSLASMAFYGLRWHVSNALTDLMPLRPLLEFSIQFTALHIQGHCIPRRGLGVTFVGRDF